MTECFECGFSRAAVRRSLYKEDSSLDYDKESRWKRYLSFFGEEEQTVTHFVDRKTFMKRSKDILNVFSNWKDKDDRVKYEEHFSVDNWKSLPKIEKMQHRVSNCRGCAVHHFPVQSTFPLKTARVKGHPASAVSRKVVSSLSQLAKPVKATVSAIKTATKTVYQQINKPFKELFGVNFNEAQTKVSQLHLYQVSPTDRKRMRRETVRKDKMAVQSMMGETEAVAVLTVRESLSQRGKKRKMQYFESREEAEIRAKKRKEMEESGSRKKKTHSPDPGKLHFDKEGLLHEVQNMKDGEKVCGIV